jgi:hypothetical protein
MLKKIISFIIRFVPRPLLQRVSPLGLRVLGWFYAGKGVQCPICEHEYKQFLPYGTRQCSLSALFVVGKASIDLAVPSRKNRFFSKARQSPAHSPRSLFYEAFGESYKHRLCYGRPRVAFGKGKNGHSPNAFRKQYL